MENDVGWSFRFLDLPKELRLLVYESLCDSPVHYNTVNDPVRGPEYDEPSAITLIAKTLPVYILATCQLVHTEALLVLKPLMDKIRAEPIRFIVNYDGFKNFAGRRGLLSAIARKTQSHVPGNPPPQVIHRWYQAKSDHELSVLAFLNRSIRFMSPPTSSVADSPRFSHVVVALDVHPDLGRGAMTTPLAPIATRDWRQFFYATFRVFRDIAQVVGGQWRHQRKVDIVYKPRAEWDPMLNNPSTLRNFFQYMQLDSLMSAAVRQRRHWRWPYFVSNERWAEDWEED